MLYIALLATFALAPQGETSATPNTPGSSLLDPAPSIGPARASKGTFIDKTVFPVHDMIITELDISFELRWATENGLVNTEAERHGKAMEILENKIDSLLKIQAGRDMGFPPEAVRRLIDSQFNDQVEDQGGHSQTAEYLKKNSYDAASYRTRLENNAYEGRWERATTGQLPGASGRHQADRFIRPGQMHAYFQLMRGNPTHMKDLGGLPESVSYQVCALPLEGARRRDIQEKAKTIQKLVLTDVAKFDELIDIHSAFTLAESRHEDIGLHELRALSPERHHNNSLLDFIMTAEIDALSEPLEGVLGGQTYIFIYQLQSRQEPQPTRFLDLDVQEHIEAEMLSLLDERRLSQAMGHLKRVSASTIMPKRSAEAPAAEPAIAPTEATPEAPENGADSGLVPAKEDGPR